MNIDTKQLNDIVKCLGYNGESNLCPVNPHKPGTALVWRRNLSITGTVSVEPRRIQLIRMPGLAVLNMYAPSGSACKEDREELFRGELALTVKRLGPRVELVTAGD